MPMTPADRVNAGPAAYMEPEEAGPTFGEKIKAGFVDTQAELSWLAETENKAAQEAVQGYDQFRDIPDDLNYLPRRFNKKKTPIVNDKEEKLQKSIDELGSKREAQTKLLAEKQNKLDLLEMEEVKLHKEFEDNTHQLMNKFKKTCHIINMVCGKYCFRCLKSDTDSQASLFLISK